MFILKYDPVTRQATPAEIKTLVLPFQGVPISLTQSSEVGLTSYTLPSLAGKTILNKEYTVTYTGGNVLTGVNAGYIIPRMDIDISTGTVAESAFVYGAGTTGTCQAIITYLD